MPHQRKRLILEILEKRLKLFPVVGVLGARQTGKSTLLREMLPELRTTRYVTLDRDEIKQEAQKRPTLFLQGLESEKIKTICIDEVQKASVLFDTIKAEVDERKRPGRFALSGSSEFSKKTGVQESLTGRIVLLRMFPLNLSEVKQVQSEFPLLNLTKAARASHSSIQLRDVRQWLSSGGMPGVFAVREEINREALFDAWVETTCTRDLAAFKIPRFNPDLARRILTAVAKAETPNRTEIAREVGKDPRQILAYLEAFKALFAVYEIEPYKTGVGKSLYYLFDSGVASHLGSSESRCLQICFLNECFSQFSYSGNRRPDIFYYASSKKSRIDFVIETQKSVYAVLLSEAETPSAYSLRSVGAFRMKHPEMPIFIVAPCLQVKKLQEGVVIVPWSLIA